MAAHGLTAYFEPVGVVDKAVQDGVCISWITDQLVPAGNWELTGNEGCAPAISVFEDFKQMVSGVAVERFQSPVVEDQQIDAGQALHTRGDAAIAFGKRQFLDQPWQSCVDRMFAGRK